MRLLILTGLALPFLSGCVPRLIVKQCPPIPKSLVTQCVMTRDIVTNADLARAYLDALECLDEQNLKLAAIAELSLCQSQ
jgi:hypothetical protein